MNAGFAGRFLGRRSLVETLRCLYSDRKGLSGREVARRSGLSHPSVHRALGELEREGIVQRRLVPPTHLFALNEKHWFVSAVLKGLFESEGRWRDDLEGLIAKGAPGAAVSLIIFGSLVEGGLRPASDVDVLALAEDADGVEAVREHLARAGGLVYEAFHHPLSPVVLTLEEFGRRYRLGEPFAKRVAYSGKVIHGLLLTEVLAKYGGKKDKR